MKNFDFVANLKKMLIISLCIMLVGVACNVIFGTNLDISFKGGTEIRYEYTSAPDLDALTKLAKDKLGANATLQMDNVNSTDVVSIKLPGDIEETQKKAFVDQMNKDFSANGLKEYSYTTLSATMGTKFLLRCLLALVLAAALLIIYVGFRFRKIGGIKAGVSALIALLHDLLIVYFVFVIFGINLNDNFVAVMLTILGYSLNDTIVIFDRIRTLRRRSDAPLEDVVNQSLHHVLRRTIVTTATTCVAILAVLVVALVMNVDSIISFALPMLFGALSGSYSSLFLSGPIWVKWMQKGEPKKA